MSQKSTFLFSGAFYELFIKNIKVFNSLVVGNNMPIGAKNTNFWLKSVSQNSCAAALYLQ